MRNIDEILLKLETQITTGNYAPLETERFEIKDLSTKNNWTELYKSVCAFLNTQGGIVIIGINENIKEKKYKFTGFDTNNENNIKQLATQIFTNETGNLIDLTLYIRPDLIEIKPFLDGHICLIFVEKLPEDEKLIFYNKVAYQRQLTGDHLLSTDKIEAHNQLKQELQRAKELQLLPNTTLADLDVDKLNEFINKLNQGLKVESLKADVAAALPFLTRKKFIRDNAPTILGMLVCGTHPHDHLSGRCQVDCYVEQPDSQQITADKKVYKDNIIPLMETCIQYVVSKINTGISPKNGGTTTYEYPIRIIRETINNALAHRNYQHDKFANINIVPNKHIEIRNPGKFRQEQMLIAQSTIALRRIIPIANPQNPKLADVLKSFDRWEGKGWGMATLTNVALENEIDVPYYRLYNENEIGLYIQKGKVLDDAMKLWLKGFGTYILEKTNGKELTTEQQTVLAYFYKSELLNQNERFTINLTPDNNHFEAIKILERYKLIQRLPESNKYVHVYCVDRILATDNFTDKLKDIFKNTYNLLSVNAQNVLEIIYQYNEYNKNTEVSASLVADTLYFKTHKTVENLSQYNAFKRTIRNTINVLEKKHFITRKVAGKANYLINSNFDSSITLF